MKFKKKLLSLLIAVLCITMCVSLASCGDDTEGEIPTTGGGEVPTQEPVAQTAPNEDRTLVLQTSTMDGVFSPFFYSSAYDGDVLGLVNVDLLTMDRSGTVVAGDQYDTVGKDYSIYYTNDLQNFTKKETFDEGDYVVYEIILKNGTKFSDGTPITVDDVLFNYYVYLDPSYDGSSTLYTLPILGLADYRTQTPNSGRYSALADSIFAVGDKYTVSATDAFTQDEYGTYWGILQDKGVIFAQSIIDYVLAKYGSNADYVATYGPKSGLINDNAKVALGMAMWGFGSMEKDENKANTDIFVDLFGDKYDINTATNLSADTYWRNLKLGYSDDNGVVDYANLDSTETAGYSLIAAANEEFVLSFRPEGAVVPNIEGLKAAKKTIDGVEYDAVRIILTKQNPKAILSLGVTVAPKHYYTAGYRYTEGAVANYGVELGNNGNTKFIEHLKKANSHPVGAGPYKFVSYNGEMVNFERNEYHETMGNENVFNALIKKVAFKVIELNKDFDALKAGDIDYATVSANADVMKDLAKEENRKLTSTLVDNNGYGYICINPNATAYQLDSLYVRVALTSVFDLAKVYDYYPSGLADVIYRSQTQVSWAYPEGATAVYPYDATLATAIENYKKAGFTFDEATGKFTDAPAIDLYLPSDAAEHPAGGIFLKAKELLETIGVTANIRMDEDLIANIKTDAVPVYALAWSSSADPDMFQVYHINSQASSVISNGIVGLYKNPDALKAEKGTIEVTKLDGSVETMNQKQALDYLAFLIDEGVRYMSVEERAPIYQSALTLLAQLNIEIPTYQRKNLFVTVNTVVDVSTLSDNVTPYWGPLAEIWKVSFVKGIN